MLEQLVVVVGGARPDPPRCRVEQEAPVGGSSQQAAAVVELVGGVPAAPVVVDERADRLSVGRRKRLGEPPRPSAHRAFPAAAFSRRSGNSVLTSNP